MINRFAGLIAYPSIKHSHIPQPPTLGTGPAFVRVQYSNGFFLDKDGAKHFPDLSKGKHEIGIEVDQNIGAPRLFVTTGGYGERQEEITAETSPEVIKQVAELASHTKPGFQARVNEILSKLCPKVSPNLPNDNAVVVVITTPQDRRLAVLG